VEAFNGVLRFSLSAILLISGAVFSLLDGAIFLQLRDEVSRAKGQTKPGGMALVSDLLRDHRENFPTSSKRRDLLINGIFGACCTIAALALWLI